MRLFPSPSGPTRPLLIGTGIALLHLGVFGVLAGQKATTVAVPEITPVQLISLAPEPASATPATPATPAPAAAPAAPRPQKNREAPAPTKPPKRVVKSEPAPRPDPVLRKDRTPTPVPRKESHQEPAAPDNTSNTGPAVVPIPNRSESKQGRADSDTPSAPAVELPSTRASYLNNPRPPYPNSSKRLGETGTVLLRVLVGAEGNAEQVSLKKSSGFDALDEAALDTVRRWRFVPGKRNGIPTAMEYTVPIAFRLD